MKKYDQLISGDVDGDCFRACMATVLQIPIDTLPNWHDNQWFLKWDKWLHERGLGITVHSSYFGVDGLWIASVKSQNYEDITHAIVMNDEDVFHDPSPLKKYKEIDTDDIGVSYHIELTDISKFNKQLIESAITEAREQITKGNLVNKAVESAVREDPNFAEILELTGDQGIWDIGSRVKHELAQLKDNTSV